MLVAIQGLAIDLVPKLTREQKDKFLKYFEDNVPKRLRVPVQDDLIAALKK